MTSCLLCLERDLLTSDAPHCRSAQAKAPTCDIGLNTRPAQQR